MCVCVCVCVRERVYLCVCVCERERESVSLCVCVCVCVCVVLIDCSAGYVGMECVKACRSVWSCINRINRIRLNYSEESVKNKTT